MMENQKLKKKRTLLVGLEKLDRKPLVLGRHIFRAGPSLDVRLGLPNSFELVLGRRLIRTGHPVAHRARQDLHPVRPLGDCGPGCVGEDIVAEAVGPAAAIGGVDQSGAVVALLETDVAVGRVIVAGVQLKLHPCGRKPGAALHAAFERIRERYERSGVRGQTHGAERVVEIGPRSTVSVPVIVVEKISLLFARPVAERDSGAAVVLFILLRRLIPVAGRRRVGLHHQFFRAYSVRQLRRVAGRGVFIGVGNLRVLGPVGGRRLVIVVFVPRTSAPSANANVRLAVRETSHKFLEFGVIFDGTDPGDLAVTVEENV